MDKTDQQYFVDSACWIALLNRQDSLHEKANMLYQRRLKECCRFVTTSSFIEETANALLNPLFRTSIISFTLIIASSRIRIIYSDKALS